MNSTFPKLLLEKSRKWQNSRIAIRRKDFGIWHTETWAGFYDHVKSFALGLKSLGFERGEHICIIGNNEPEWIYAELAAQSLGGAAIGIYQDSNPPEVRYIIEKSDAVYIVVEDQEQADKLLEIEKDLPLLRKVIYWDPKGMRNYREPILMTFSEVQENGRTYEQQHPDVFEIEIAKGKPDDTAVILATSGTTSFPKLAMISHRNILTMGESLLLKKDIAETSDEFVSFLPLPWVGEQMMCLTGSLVVGLTINFPEEPTTIQENLREIAPHMMFSPPSVWEGMLSNIQVKIEDASFLKRLIYKKMMTAGYRAANAKFDKRALTLSEKTLNRLAYILLFRALKDRLGMSRIRRAYSGGAALGPDVFKFFHAIGVNLKQIYGQTEISGVSVAHSDDDIKFETVGHPVGDTEIKISADGEILAKSPCVFQGYYKDPEATARTLNDGWLHSGDAGYIDDDGHLVVIDRMNDVMRLADGSIFSPQFIENKLKFSQYIREAVIFGKEQPYVAAFINIDFLNVGRWAENRHLAYTTYTDLSQKEAVYKSIKNSILEVNNNLPMPARIKRFVILHKELDADDQELTRTKKVRRGFIAEKYSELISALYGDSSTVSVEAKVTYRDGREEIIKTAVKVETMF